MSPLSKITCLLLTGFLVVTFPVLSLAEESGPLFVKVFAGESTTSHKEFDKEVRKNLKAKITVPDETVLDCETGKRYGLGVIVSAPGKQSFSFATTAIWRNLNSDDVPRRSTREHTLRKIDYGTRRFFFTIRDGSIDHDMTFVAHIGKEVYLRHKFLIRGCQAVAPAG